MVGHHPVKFVYDRLCGSRGIMFLICHVISKGHVNQVCQVLLQDHMIKGSCDFMGRSPSR